MNQFKYISLILLFIFSTDLSYTKNCPEGLSGQKCRFQDQHNELMILYDENLQIINEIKSGRIIQSVPSKVRWLSDVGKCMSYIYWINIQYGDISVLSTDLKDDPNPSKPKPSIIRKKITQKNRIVQSIINDNNRPWNPFNNNDSTKVKHKIRDNLIRLNPDMNKPETNRHLFNDRETVLCIPDDIFRTMKDSQFIKPDDTISTNGDTTCFKTNNVNSDILQGLLKKGESTQNKRDKDEKKGRDTEKRKVLAVSQTKFGETIKRYKNKPDIISDLGNSLENEDQYNNDPDKNIVDNSQDDIKDSTKTIHGEDKKKILQVMKEEQGSNFEIDDYDVANIIFCEKLLNRLKNEGSISEKTYKRRIGPCRKNRYFFSSYKLGKVDPSDTEQGDRAVELMNEILKDHYIKHGSLNDKKITAIIYGHGDYIPFTKEELLPTVTADIYSCKNEDGKNIKITHNSKGKAILTNDILPCVRAYFLKKYLQEKVGFISKQLNVILRGKVHKEKPSENTNLGVPENRAVSVYFIRQKED